MVMVLWGTISILLRSVDPSERVKRLVVYWITSSLLCIFFWPEATQFGNERTVLEPTQVASYAASQDPNAPIVTAAQAGEEATTPVIETHGFRLVLGLLTDWPLRIARQLNRQTHRTFSSMIGMSWLLGLELTGEANRALADWVEGCWKPSMLEDQEFQDAVTAAELLPWGDTPAARALATRETIPGAQTGRGYFRTQSPLGLAFLSNPGSGPGVRCDVYLAQLQMAVERWLFLEKSPAGVPLSQVFQEDLGRPVEWQARFLIYREALRHLGRPSPAPSLAGSYAGLAGAQVVTGATSGALGAVSQSRSSRGGLWGAVFGAGQGAMNQFESMLSTVTWTVGLAMWFIYWSPFIFGIALQQMIGLFPVILCYGFIPGQPLRALVTYCVALAYICCGPLWLAMVDLASRWAATLAPQSEDALLSLFNWAPAQVYSTVAVVVGLFVVHVIGAGILFVSGRAMVGFLRH
jgi:hypothetical protein